MLKLICVLICIFFVTYNESCSCQPNNDEVNFCNASFVMKGQLTKRSVSQDEPFYIYEVTPQIVFSDTSSSLIENSKALLYAPLYEPFCGLRLSIDNNVYLLSGSFEGNKAQTNLCRWHLHWNDVEEELKEKLEGRQISC